MVKCTSLSRGVAQVARVRAWGARGRKFKSCHSDQTEGSGALRRILFYLSILAVAFVCG